MEFKINKLIGDSQSANANVGEIDKYIQTNFTCTLLGDDQYRSYTRTGSDGKERVHIKMIHIKMIHIKGVKTKQKENTWNCNGIENVNQNEDIVTAQNKWETR